MFYILNIEQASLIRSELLLGLPRWTAPAGLLRATQNPEFQEGQLRVTREWSLQSVRPFPSSPQPVGQVRVRERFCKKKVGNSEGQGSKAYILLLSDREFSLLSEMRFWAVVLTYVTGLHF